MISCIGNLWKRVNDECYILIMNIIHNSGNIVIAKPYRNWVEWNYPASLSQWWVQNWIKRVLLLLLRHFHSTLLPAKHLTRLTRLAIDSLTSSQLDQWGQSPFSRAHPSIIQVNRQVESDYIGWQRVSLSPVVQGVFLTGTPPKKLKYGKPRLGVSTLT